MAPKDRKHHRPRITRLEHEHIEGRPAQVDAALLAVTTTEASDVVRGAGNGAGFEAWRRLRRRHDPGTAGRSRGLLRDILSPP